MKAPLLLGTDVTNMTDATLSTVTNPEVIAVNQDSLGIQAKMIHSESSTSNDTLTWAGQLEKGDLVALVVNNAESTRTLALDLAHVLKKGGATYKARDLWKRQAISGVYSSKSVLRFPHVQGH